MRLALVCLAFGGLFAIAGAQDTLTLDQALGLGKERNGTILAAMQDLHAARSRLTQSKAAYFPTVSVSYGYSDSRTDDYRVARNDPFRTVSSRGTLGTLNTSLTLLDTGERALGVRSASYGLQGQELTTLQTLRATLVDVYVRFVEALRAQELQRVAQADVSRSDDVLKQAEAQAKVGDIAQKDVLQPRADALNAKVSLLSAQNQTSVANANLKAGIGWDKTSNLPPLSPLPPQPDTGDLDLQTIVQQGLANRSDLKAQRKLVDQYGVAVSQAKLSYGPTLDAGYSYNRQAGSLSDNGSGSFSVLLSYPLFDGFDRREAVKIAQDQLAAARADLKQSEREAAAEIESLVHEVDLDRQRIDAANSALDAAKVNFEAVFKAKQLGAQGADVVAVSTAQVSLVTAETNAIQATYDYAVARVRLKLATGEPVPGESA